MQRRRSTLRGCRRSAPTRATGATRAVRMHHHPVVVVMMVEATVTGVPAESEASEENDRDDEDDPRDDGNPRREQEDLGGLVDVWRWVSGRRYRCCCGRGPHGWGFRCFTHETHDARVNSSCSYALRKSQL